MKNMWQIDRMIAFESGLQRFQHDSAFNFLQAQNIRLKTADGFRQVRQFALVAFCCPARRAFRAEPHGPFMIGNACRVKEVLDIPAHQRQLTDVGSSRDVRSRRRNRHKNPQRLEEAYHCLNIAVDRGRLDDRALSFCIRIVSAREVTLMLASALDSLLRLSTIRFPARADPAMLLIMKLSGKLMSVEALRIERDRLHAGRRKLVFTNGCFDLLHAGHVQYLDFARQQGDALAVGLNSDASVRRAKGPERPLVPQAYRAQVLLALRCVDYVAFFDDDEPQALIAAILPHVLVKGSDWRHYVSGRKIVEAHGGRVVLAELLPGFSTTSLVEKIRGA